MAIILITSYFAKFMGAEDMTILSLVMRKRSPDYFETLHFIHRQMWIKPVHYYKKEDGQKVLQTYSAEDMEHFALYESLQQNELANKVLVDRKEKFDNPQSFWD